MEYFLPSSANVSGWEKIVGVIRPQKIVPGFSFNILWTEQIDVIVSILLDRPN